MNSRKKKFGTRSLMFCAIVLAAILGFALAACDNGTTTPPAPVDENPFVYSYVVGGKTVQITISRANPDEATTAPQAGDSYVITVDDEVVSKGTITTVSNGGEATFTPSRDSR